MIWYLDSTPVQKNQECAVPLGVQGDNQTLRYTADVSDWLALWPSGVVALVLQAPDRSEPYMANTSIDRETGIVTWTVTAFDTSIVGYGYGELRIVENDVIKKSYRFATYIRPSILATAAEPPAPYPDWITELLEAASDTQANVVAAQAAQTAAEAAQSAAEESAGTAATFAEAAAASATSAASSKEAAASSAVGAHVSETRAANFANYARGYSTEAHTSAIQAAGSATDAAGSATQAAGSVTAAETAQASAETAQAAAEAAQAAAETAQGKAEDAQAAAEAAASSAISDIQTQQQTSVAAVQSAGQTQITNIESKGAQTIASIPADYTTLSGDVSNLKSALTTLDAEQIKGRTVTNTGTDYSVWATNDVDLSEEGDYYAIVLSTSGVDVSTRPYMEVRNVYSSGAQEITGVYEVGRFVKIKRDFTRTYTRTNIAFLRSDAALSTAVTSSWTYAIFKGEPNKNRIAELSDAVVNAETNIASVNSVLDETLADHQYTSTQSSDLVTVAGVDIKAGEKFFVNATLESGESTGINIYANSSSSAMGGVMIRVISYGSNFELTAPVDMYQVVGYIRGNNSAAVSLVVNADSRLTSIENIANDLSEEIISVPFYAKDIVETVKSTLSPLQGSKSITLGFITDIHVNGERDNDDTQRAMFASVAALNDIHKENPIDLVVLNGDYLYNTSSTTKATALKWYADLLKTFSYTNAPLFIGKGNHDANDITGSLTQYLSDDEIYRAFSKRGTADYVGNYGYIEKGYGYFDIPNKKVRVIVIDTVDNPFVIESDTIKYKEQYTICVCNEQLNFIGNALKFTDEGWGVVFISHHALQNGSGINPDDSTDVYVPLNHGGTQLLGIINAFRDKTSYSDNSGSGDFVYNVSVDFTANKSNEVIVMLSGHTHRDLSDNVDGIQMIATTAASFVYTAYYADGTKIDRVLQTKTETSWDIVTIDREIKKIYCTRYGAGTDRVFDY